MTDAFVDIRVKVENFSTLLHCIADLPKPFRPQYFTVGERVRNKDASRIDDVSRFSRFVDDHVRRVSGCDLIGDKIRFGVFVGETRSASHQSTHVGCSALLRTARWCPADMELLLRRLCEIPGVERGDACLRDEWARRHRYVKQLPNMSIEGSVGVDMSAQLPGLYWWTVFSEALARRHHLDRGELENFAVHSECWGAAQGGELYAFRIYDAPDQWSMQDARVTSFLERHRNFFSISRLQPLLDAAQTKQQLDMVVRPHLAGAVPWESVPIYA